MAKRDKIPLKQATEKLARDEVNDILRYANSAASLVLNN